MILEILNVKKFQFRKNYTFDNLMHKMFKLDRGVFKFSMFI